MIHPCLHPACRRERYGARQMCTAAAAATAASTAATAERVHMLKTEQEIRDWAGSRPFFHKRNEKEQKYVKSYQKM